MSKYVYIMYEFTHRNLQPSRPHIAATDAFFYGADATLHARVGGASFLKSCVRQTPEDHPTVRVKQCIRNITSEIMYDVSSARFNSISTMVQAVGMVAFQVEAHQSCHASRHVASQLVSKDHNRAHGAS